LGGGGEKTSNYFNRFLSLLWKRGRGRCAGGTGGGVGEAFCGVLLQRKGSAKSVHDWVIPSLPEGGKRKKGKLRVGDHETVHV